MLIACLVAWSLYISIMLYVVAEISHAGYLVENLKPPDRSEPGLESHFNAVDVKHCYLPGKWHGEDR